MWNHSRFPRHRQARFRKGRRVPRQQRGALVDGASGSRISFARAAEIRDGRDAGAAGTDRRERAAVGEGVAGSREDDRGPRTSYSSQRASPDRGETLDDRRIARRDTHDRCSRIDVRGADLLLDVPSSADRREDRIQLRA